MTEKSFFLEMRWADEKGTIQSASIGLPSMKIERNRKEFSELDILQAMDYVDQLRHIRESYEASKSAAAANSR